MKVVSDSVIRTRGAVAGYSPETKVEQAGTTPPAPVLPKTEWNGGAQSANQPVQQRLAIQAETEVLGALRRDVQRCVEQLDGTRELLERQALDAATNIANRIRSSAGLLSGLLEGHPKQAGYERILDRHSVTMGQAQKVSAPPMMRLPAHLSKDAIRAATQDLHGEDLSATAAALSAAAREATTAELAHGNGYVQFATNRHAIAATEVLEIARDLPESSLRKLVIDQLTSALTQAGHQL